MVLGVYTTPNLSTLSPLFLVLFSLIFTASKAKVARSNRAGQANFGRYCLFFALNRFASLSSLRFGFGCLNWYWT